MDLNGFLVNSTSMLVDRSSSSAERGAIVSLTLLSRWRCACAAADLRFDSASEGERRRREGAREGAKHTTFPKGSTWIGCVFWCCDFLVW